MRAIPLSCAILFALPALYAGAVRAAPPLSEPDTAAAERLTANQLASLVLETNPGLAAAEAAAEAATYRIDPAGSLPDPMLSYGVAPLTAGSGGSLDQSVEVSQRFPWPGTLAAREAAASFEAAAAARDADSLRLSLVAKAKSAWAEWRFVHAALQTSRDTRELLEDLVATAGTRYAAGQALQQDVLQAELERARVDNRLLDLRRERVALQARINALLHRAPDEPLPPAAAITLREPPPPLATLQTRALTRHPELSRLEAELSAGESRVTLAEKAFFPDFEIGVGYNGVMDPADKRPMFGVSINLPFDRGRRHADLDQARAAAHRARLSLSQRSAELLADLAAARAEVIQARESVELYRDRLVPLAAQYLAAALADYRSGSGAFLNVIDAERGRLESELALARALSDYARRQAALERWSGGSLEPADRPTSAGTRP